MKPKSIQIFVEETNVNLYAWQIIIQAFFRSKHLLRYIPFPPRSQMALIKDDAGQSGIDRESWKQIGESIMSDLESGKLNLKRLSAEHTMLAERVWKVYRAVQRAELSMINSRQFIIWFKRMWEDFFQLNGIGMVPVASDYFHNLLSTRLTGILQSRKVKELQLHNYLNLLMSPDTPTAAFTELTDLLEIIARHKKYSQVVRTQNFKDHLEKYKWLNYGYQGPRVPRTDFASRVRKLLASKQSISKKISEQKAYFGRLRKQQRALERKLRLTPKEKFLFGAARLFTYLKAYRVDARHYFHFVSDQIFFELGSRYKLPIAWFRYAERSQILRLLKGGKIDRKLPLARRKKLLYVIERGGKEYYVAKAKIFAFYQKYVFTESVTKTESLKGMPAFLGKVRGEVKIVLGLKDVAKVKHGDILVAPTTNPDLLPAMYRALAFVTNQGGITSHAAIVARELKKPCIIGTKFATKVFKDGDMVEVDANKGIVKKI